MANTLPLIEVEFFNCMWNKRILTPQPNKQTGVTTVPGSTGMAATNVYPLNNVYAPPLTFVNSGTIKFPTLPYTESSTAALSGSVVKENIYVEESRIRGGYNNVQMDLGARAYLNEDEPLQQHRLNTLIYSGVFNSLTGINRTNEFPVGTNITRSANPQYNSIQKIYAEENNLVVLQEDKCSRCLIDKNAIYNAEGGGSVTTTNQVLGEIIPYTGEYGISKNPESFAIYAYRKYFVDRNRNAVLRLSGNGVTEISEYGMRDYFRDQLTPLTDNYTNTYTKILSGIAGIDSTTASTSVIGMGSSSTMGLSINYFLGAEVYWRSSSTSSWVNTTATVTGIVNLQPTLAGSGSILLDKILDPTFFVSGNVNQIKLVGKYRSRIPAGYDIYNKQYVLSIQPNNTVEDSTNGNLRRDFTYYTLGFDEAINGWPSFYTYRPAQIGSLKNTYYTSNNHDWYGSGNSTLGVFQHYNDAVPRGQFYGVDNPSTVSIVANSQPSLQKAFLTIDYEGDSGWQVSSVESDQTGSNRILTQTTGVWNGDWNFFKDQSTIIYSYAAGAYDSLGNIGTAANPVNQPLLRAGFDRKENRYVANFINTSTANNAEVLYGNQISGLKGYYLDVTLSTDGITNPGAMKELYAVGLSYNVSAR